LIVFIFFIGCYKRFERKTPNKKGVGIMATYVLCHGGWVGGWQWREVAGLLKAAGHEVFTPTFTGLGERVHLANPEIDLKTYIQDILMLLKYEDLRSVILLGYSLSGPVITGVAEEAAERIGHLVYLDAYVLEDGQSVADQLGEQMVAGLQQAADTAGDGWRLPHNPPDADRRTDQSIKFMYNRVRANNPAASQIPRTFIFCTQGGQDIGPLHLPIAQAAEKARSDNRWRYCELNTGHVPMWTTTLELANLLLEVGETPSAA
jgi:pimeloyl-ACP methyl ester carboxylesterase